ncbi:Cytochrome monooxygenase like protein [Verticillium longisporum]
MADQSVPVGADALTTLDHGQLRTSALIGVVVIAILMLLNSIITIKPEQNEPPLLKPTIPLVGHIINMVRHGTMLLSRYRKHNLPAATLPMLNGKMYVIWDASLVQALFRRKSFTLEHFAAKFSGNVAGLNSSTRNIFLTTPLVKEMLELFSKHLLKGETLQRAQIAAVCSIEDSLRGEFTSLKNGEWLEISSIYTWLRDITTLAASRAFWGPQNPLDGDHTLLEDFWHFENKLLIMALDLYLRFAARKAYDARARVQAAFGRFHAAGLVDSDGVSELIRERARLIRSYGVASEEIGKMETSILAVALSNTAPTLVWLLSSILSTPGLAERVRGELENAARRDGDEAMLSVSSWEQCPLLVSCYHETLRLMSRTTVTRRSDEDATLVGADGREYMIRAGVDVQASATALHTDPRIWGSDVDTFDPGRFLPFTKDPLSQSVRQKKAAFIPFGGGRNMCPGRSLAFAQVMTFVAVLLLGYDVEPGKGSREGTHSDAKLWKKPPQKTRGSMAEAIAKPVNKGEGYDARLRPKAGWERVRWHFDI